MKQSLLTTLLNSGKIMSIGEGRMMLAQYAIKVNGQIVTKDIDVEMCDEICVDNKFRFLVSTTDLS